jgi:multidrug efflux pump subunit AcrB
VERKKKRWLLGCGLLAAVLGLSALGVLAWLGWAVHSAWTKPGPVIEVVTCYPGMPASSIEKTITNRIERWVNQAPGCDRLTSRSLNGVSIVRATFRNDMDLDAALTLVNQLAQSTLPTLPPDILPPLVLPRDPRFSDPLGMLGVSSDTVEDAVLQELADVTIRHRLIGVPGAVAPIVLGGKDHPIVINLDPKKMATRKVSLKDVRTVVEMFCDKDRIHTDKNGLLIQANFQFLKNDELDLLKTRRVRAEDGEMVRLGDLGVVQDQSAAPAVRLRIDSRPVVGVPVYLQTNAPQRDVYEKFTDALPSLREELERREVHLRWVPLGIEHKWLRAQDDGLLKIYLRAPSNARLSDTEKHVAAVEGFLEKSIPAKEREAIVSEMGMKPDFSTIYTANAGPMDATLYVQLSRDRTLSAAAYASKLRRLLRDEADFANLSIRFTSRDMPAPVKVRVVGGKHEEGLRLAQEVLWQLANIKGVVDVDIAQRMDAPYLLVTTNRGKAAAVGLNPQDVLAQIFAVLQPHAPRDRDFWSDVKSGDEPSLTVPFPTDPAVKLEDALETIAAGANVKQPIKLSSLATLQRITAPVEIDHDSLQRVLDVRANIEDRDRRDVIADIRKMLAELKPSEGVRVELVE